MEEFPKKFFSHIYIHMLNETLSQKFHPYFIFTSDQLLRFRTPNFQTQNSIFTLSNNFHIPTAKFWGRMQLAVMDCFQFFINFLYVLQVSIITSGYDTIQRTQLVIHIYTKKLTFVCKDGRVLHFSHEPQELRDFILCQISQHQVRIRVCSKFQIWN